MKYSNLKIRFGRDPYTEVHMPDLYFDSEFELSWFDHPIVDEILREIDGMVKRIDECIWVKDHLREGKIVAISPRALCGGTKAMLLMLNTDYVVSAGACGSNCAKFILEIAKIKPIEISLNYCMDFKEDFKAICMNDGDKINNIGDYLDKMGYYVYGEGRHPEVNGYLGGLYEGELPDD